MLTFEGLLRWFTFQKKTGITISYKIFDQGRVSIGLFLRVRVRFKTPADRRRETERENMQGNFGRQGAKRKRKQRDNGGEESKKETKKREQQKERQEQQ